MWEHVTLFLSLSRLCRRRQSRAGGSRDPAWVSRTLFSQQSTVDSVYCLPEGLEATDAKELSLWGGALARARKQ